MIPFCSAPFHSFSVKPEGFRPCCSRHALPIQGDDAIEWWNSDYLKAFRKRMFDQKTLPDECLKCLASNDTGGQKYSPTIDVVEHLGYNMETGEVLASPKQILYFISNKCNLACRMCDSTFSDMHAKILPELIIPIKEINPGYTKLENNIAAITSCKPNSIVIYGGEPFFDKKLYDRLTLFLTETTAVISFLTNGSYSLEKHKAFLLIKENAERFTFTFSIDGPPELNEAIRINCNTKLIEQNIELCKAHGICFDIHLTLSNMNIHALPEWIDYVETTFGDDVSYNIASVEFPTHFAPHLRPDIDDVRIKLISYYWKKKITGKLTAVARRALLSTIQKLTSPQDITLIEKYNETMRYIDSRQNSRL